VGNPRPPEPARAVEVERYLGKWYELARYDMAFERGCEGVTAEYSLRPDGLIKVVNSCHKGAPDGPLAVAEGRAKRVGDPLGARLKVSFFGPFYADYWILDHDDDGFISTDPTFTRLYLYTRPDKDTPELRERLAARAKALGYDVSKLEYPAQP